MTLSKNNNKDKITVINNTKSGSRSNCSDYGFKPNQRKCWSGHTLRKMKVGDTEEAHRVINENDFKHAKFIMLRVGTNQVEKINIAAEISKDIIKIGLRLKTLYPSKEIFISQLPPRNDRSNLLTQNINELLENSLPVSA